MPDDPEGLSPRTHAGGSREKWQTGLGGLSGKKGGCGQEARVPGEEGRPQCHLRSVGGEARWPGSRGGGRPQVREGHMCP